MTFLDQNPVANETLINFPKQKRIWHLLCFFEGVSESDFFVFLLIMSIYFSATIVMFKWVDVVFPLSPFACGGYIKLSGEHKWHTGRVLFNCCVSGWRGMLPDLVAHVENWSLLRACKRPAYILVIRYRPFVSKVRSIVIGAPILVDPWTDQAWRWHYPLTPQSFIFPRAFDRLPCHLPRAMNARPITVTTAMLSFLLTICSNIIIMHTQNNL